MTPTPTNVLERQASTPCPLEDSPAPPAGGPTPVWDALVAELGDPRTGRRPWTPPEQVTREDGTEATRWTMKRVCNGCRLELGDTTEAEVAAAVDGLPLPDVRGECLVCAPPAGPGRVPEETR